jgi:glutamine synthetase
VGVPRSKLVPTVAMDDMEKTGAGFAAFATYLDIKPSDPDTFAIPDAPCAVQLPWKPEVAWVPADVVCRGKPVAHAPRNVLKAQIKKAAAQGLIIKTGVEVEFFILTPDASGPVRAARGTSPACVDVMLTLSPPVVRHVRSRTPLMCR